MDVLFTPLALMLLMIVFAVLALLLGEGSRDDRAADTRRSLDIGDH